MTEHRPLLWSLAYRILGSAADADEIAQEAILRALEHRPAEPRPWMVKVACNLARDRLRRRRRAPYPGTWLPEPVPLPEDLVGSRESANMAWMLALETLTPAQRSVLVLREVMDYSAAEAGQALGMSEANVRVTHHRARNALRTPPPQNLEQSGAALGALLTALAAGDAVGAEAMLSASAQALSDGGGKVQAFGVPLHGAARIVRAFLALARHNSPEDEFELCQVNGLPALRGRRAHPEGRIPPVYYLQVILDENGQITQLLSFLHPEKLERLEQRRGP